MKTKELIKLTQAASKVKNPSALEAFKYVLEKFDSKNQIETIQEEHTYDNNQIKEHPDGIYVIYQDGEYELFEKGMKITGTVQYIGLKLGRKSIAIALKDASDDKVTLTINEDKSSYNKYSSNSIDAMDDWNGQENTDHLKQIGLNPKIKLNDGEYVPAVGEISFINLFLKEINKALTYIGGQPLSGWCWTSTEYSSSNAWNLNLGNGILSAFAKVSNQLAVRAVSAFSL